MAGTATNYLTSLMIQGVVQIWGGLAIPAAGDELVLHTDGTPDATANPLAIHFGHTTEGASILVKPGLQQFFTDETEDPVIDNIESSEAVISCNLVQAEDFAKLSTALPGATYATEVGKETMKFGGLTTITYQSVAAIWRRRADATKFAWVQLYKAINDGGLALEIGRKKLTGVPVAFRGRAITTRAAGDFTGALVKQV